MAATIHRLNERDLLVNDHGNEYRRISGQWQMRSAKGKWFDCEIHEPSIRNQVADFENCLRTYGLNDGPSYPIGRHKAESVGEFVRRKQAAELASATKGIFKPVSLHYDPHSENLKRLGTHVRRVHSLPFDSDHLTT